MGITRVSSKDIVGICELDMSRLTGEVTLLDYDSMFPWRLWSHNLSRIDWPWGLISIGNSCFSMTGVAVLDLRGTSLRRFGNDAFGLCCRLAQLFVPGTLEIIGSLCFWGTALEDVSLSHCRSLVSVGRWAFCRCDKLRRLTLPAHPVREGESLYACALGGGRPVLNEFEMGGMRSYRGDEGEPAVYEPADCGDGEPGIVTLRSAEHMWAKSMFPTIGRPSQVLFAGSAAINGAPKHPLPPAL
jgi:hypothetical protein